MLLSCAVLCYVVRRCKGLMVAALFMKALSSLPASGRFFVPSFLSLSFRITQVRCMSYPFTHATKDPEWSKHVKKGVRRGAALYLYCDRAVPNRSQILHTSSFPTLTYLLFLHPSLSHSSQHTCDILTIAPIMQESHNYI